MMFGTLFLKECRLTLKSLAYWAYVACLVLFFASQLGETDWSLVEPEPGHEGEYGYTYSTDEATVMAKTIERLTGDYAQNGYGAYPLGFYKRVSLGEKKKERMAEILSELTEGRVSFDRFLELMDEVDGLIGGGSMYMPSRLKNGVQVPQTYEGALAEYRDMVEKDRYSGAFARLFCDYMGLMAAILPVFPAVARTLRDRRSKVSPALYSKRSSSACILLARYLALLALSMAPILLLAGMAQLRCSAAALEAGLSADSFAFFKYVGGWIFPAAAFSVAMGLFVSELTGSVAAVLVQGIFWFAGVFQSIDTLVGSFGLKFIPRFNSLGDTARFEREFMSLVGNRIFYGILSLVLVAAAVFVYDWKRRGGGFSFGSLRKHKHGLPETSF